MPRADQKPVDRRLTHCPDPHLRYTLLGQSHQPKPPHEKYTKMKQALHESYPKSLTESEKCAFHVVLHL